MAPPIHKRQSSATIVDREGSLTFRGLWCCGRGRSGRIPEDGRNPNGRPLSARDVHAGCEPGQAAHLGTFQERPLVFVRAISHSVSLLHVGSATLGEGLLRSAGFCVQHRLRRCKPLSCLDAYAIFSAKRAPLNGRDKGTESGWSGPSLTSRHLLPRPPPLIPARPARPIKGTSHI